MGGTAYHRVHVIMPARNQLPHINRALRIVLPIAFAFALLPLPGCSSDTAKSLGWARRGEFYLRGGDGGQVVVEYSVTPGGEDYLYLFAPDGRRAATEILPAGTEGTRTFTLANGPGVYRLAIAPGHRYRVRAPGDSLVFVPETLFPAFFQKSGEGGPYIFRVEEGQSFTLHATNQNDYQGTAGTVTLTDPDGKVAGELHFDELTEEGLWKRLGSSESQAAGYRARADTATVPEFKLLSDSIEIASAAAGYWTVTAGTDSTNADDIGLWLTGVPNVLAPDRKAWFSPAGWSATSAAISVEADSIMGGAGAIGVVWDWPAFHDQASKVFRDMGLQADVHYLPQDQLEPVNDDPDPLHATASGFKFAAWAFRMGPPSRDHLDLSSLMALTRPAAWTSGRPEEFAEFAEAAVAFHSRLPGVDPEALWWQLGNEPNHEVRRETYAELYRVVGERLRHSTDERVRRARFGGPAIGNAAGESTALALDWIETLLRTAEPLVDFVVWNQYRLSALEDTWRFGDMVRQTRELTRRTDTDGRLPEIVIGATNMRGGIVLHNEKQDGFYGALWWASAVASAMATGDVRMMNYFYLIDEGSRRKGLLFGNGAWKPVGRMTALLTRGIHGDVIRTACDHSEVDVLATRGVSPAGEEKIQVLLVNRMPREVELSPLRVRLPSGWADTAVRTERRRYADGDREPMLVEPKSAGTEAAAEAGVIEYRESLPASSVVVITLVREARPGA